MDEFNDNANGPSIAYFWLSKSATLCRLRLHRFVLSFQDQTD